MRLDRHGAPSTIAGLLARFGDTRQWLHDELTFLEEDGQQAAEQAGSVRVYPGGLSSDEPIETAAGPFVVVVDGDLTTPDYVRFSTDDYIPGLVVVTGDLSAGTLWFECGARVVVEGSAVVTRACFGRWGDHNAMLHVDGELDTSLLALDGQTPVYAERGIRSLIYGGLGWWKTLKPDILPHDGGHDRYFPPELMTGYATLDFDLAFAAARAGSPLLLPGVEESFPGRLEARPAACEP